MILSSSQCFTSSGPQLQDVDPPFRSFDVEEGRHESERDKRRYVDVLPKFISCGMTRRFWNRAGREWRRAASVASDIREGVPLHSDLASHISGDMNNLSDQ